MPARLSVYDVAARTSREIVKGDYQIIQMAWSPDSSRIAYTTMPTTRADDSRFTDVMVVDVAAATTRKLVESAGPDMNPSWSPDSKWIAFSTKPLKNATITQSTLVVVSASGGTPRSVTGDFLYQPG